MQALPTPAGLLAPSGPHAFPRSRRTTRRTVAAALIALAASLVAIATPSHGATILRVAPTGQNSAGCGTEASPCRTIQYAINQIPSTGTVLVAGSRGGTKYTFDPATDICSPPL